VARFVLFLGAGASRRFALPTSDQLLKKIRRRFPGDEARIDRLLNRAEMAGFNANLETLLGILDSGSDPQKAIQVMGPFASAIADPRRVRRLRPKIKDSELSTKIKDFILRQYFVNSERVVGDILKTCDDFFRGLKDRFELPPLSRTHHLYPSLDIFTTNFDNVIEIFGRESNTPVFNGHYHRPQLGWVYDHRKFVDGSMRTSIRLYKIHGTVTHAAYSAGRVIDEVTNLPKRGRLIIRGRPALPRLTYPGAYHYFSEEPQLELLYLLKKKLCWATRCLVIGYSFGDPNIVQVFTDCIEMNPSLKVILLSKHAKSTIGDTSYNPKRVIAIPARVEDIEIRKLKFD